MAEGIAESFLALKPTELALQRCPFCIWLVMLLRSEIISFSQFL
jgi:hypothetical protein